jgi:hypothetical protein
LLYGRWAESGEDRGREMGGCTRICKDSVTAF